MVLRTFFAIDSDNLVVTGSSNGSIVGNGIINNSDTPNGTTFVYSSGGGTSVTVDDTDTFADAIPEDNNLFSTTMIHPTMSSQMAVVLLPMVRL